MPCFWLGTMQPFPATWCKNVNACYSNIGTDYKYLFSWQDIIALEHWLWSLVDYTTQWFELFPHNINCILTHEKYIVFYETTMDNIRDIQDKTYRKPQTSPVGIEINMIRYAIVSLILYQGSRTCSIPVCHHVLTTS